MPTILVPVEQTRPKDATPERAYALKQLGVTVEDIAKQWHISKSRVYALIAKGRPKDHDQVIERVKVAMFTSSTML